MHRYLVMSRVSFVGWLAEEERADLNSTIVAKVGDGFVKGMVWEFIKV